MWQWVALDRLAKDAYYHVRWVALMVAAGCGAQPEALAPEGLPVLSRADVAQWVRGYIPDHPLRYDLRWLYQTQQGRTRGRAAVRYVPPDSLRFDYRAPFGRSGAAVAVGDSVLWSEPEGEANNLVAVTSLFWAAMGIPRYPAAEAAVTGRARGGTRVWRYAAGLDTLTYLATEQSPVVLRCELRHGRQVIGTVDVEFADSTGLPISARMLFPSSAAQVFFTVQAIDSLATVDPAIWKRP
ncbi:MAG: hypothetical protein GTN62_08840 [Gemmatimonadales bacterium]|nr:hypothetical protein [Gemmatimonadales bacterium]NIN50202.1 hypothetical protein [Gemmatimonadales bacterium]NIP07666.1 hypothetical protein [Gemmatimonadales bacterium]NIR01818.1 hypothetical protein [Gemmatimonadales bacterium]NIS65721.1 hypothetical protein [Gemmatimonadales bacterium]